MYVEYILIWLQICSFTRNFDICMCISYIYTHTHMHLFVCICTLYKLYKAHIGTVSYSHISVLVFMYVCICSYICVYIYTSVRINVRLCWSSNLMHTYLWYTHPLALSFFFSHSVAHSITPTPTHMRARTGVQQRHHDGTGVVHPPAIQTRWRWRWLGMYIHVCTLSLTHTYIYICIYMYIWILIYTYILI